MNRIVQVSNLAEFTAEVEPGVVRLKGQKNSPARPCPICCKEAQ